MSDLQHGLKNDRLIRALLRQPVDMTPVWMMRQAGRYLPEYRATRSQAGDFMSLCQNPQLACEVTMQPLERYDFDAAILFSDILTIPDAMGLGLHFVTGEGPKFHKPITSIADIEQLEVIKTTQDLSYVTDAVRVIRNELNGRVPLIGFSGSPWTLACYMIEGESTREFKKIKHWAYNEPQALHLLLEKLALSVADYLNAQIDAGAQVIQIFDTWGGILPTKTYLEFSLAYMQKIVSALKTHDNKGCPIPTILFTKQSAQWLSPMAQTGASALSLDWTVDIGQARAQVGSSVALQGNMDPAMLRAKPQRIRQEVEHILERFGKGSGHVFNLGHGIAPDIDPANVKVYVDAVHELSVQYHQ